MFTAGPISSRTHSETLLPELTFYGTVLSNKYFIDLEKNFEDIFIFDHKRCYFQHLSVGSFEDLIYTCRSVSIKIFDHLVHILMLRYYFFHNQKVH